MEFRSFDKGVLLKILAPEGSALKPDAPVAIIGERGEDVTALVATLKLAPAGTVSVSGAESALPVAGPRPELLPPAAPAAMPAVSGPTASAPTVVEQQAPRAALAPGPGSAPQPVSANGGRSLASPLVRKLARERGVDLAQVRGSGPHGRIIKRDLDTWTTTRASAFGDVSAPLIGPRVEPLSQMRKTIAPQAHRVEADGPALLPDHRRGRAAAPRDARHDQHGARDGQNRPQDLGERHAHQGLRRGAASVSARPMRRSWGMRSTSTSAWISPWPWPFPTASSRRWCATRTRRASLTSPPR
jgi:pyruvate/2-oxoglutarate dehydrogenase complex dihydrolipoamide acyltransferase (E2) component